MYGTVYNTGDSPVVCSVNGRSCDGGGWAPVNLSDPKVKDGLESGALVEVVLPEDTSQTDPAVLAVFERASGYAERAAAAAELDKAALLKLAKSADLVGRDDEDEAPLVDELRRLIVEESIVNIPKPKQSRSNSAANE